MGNFEKPLKMVLPRHKKTVFGIVLGDAEKSD
jgi:hypothetical protein